MRGEPEAFAFAVYGAVGGLASVAFAGIPGQTFPVGGHLVFVLVAAEGDAQEWVLSVGDGPLADLVGDLLAVHAVEVGSRLAVSA